MAKSVKEYERLKSPKSMGLQEFARIANGAKVIPDDEKLGQITQYLCGFADSENRLTTK